MRLSQVGEQPSSKSAMKTCTGAFSDSMTVLRSGGASDLHAAVQQVRRHRRDSPASLSQPTSTASGPLALGCRPCRGAGQKIRQGPVIQLRLARSARREQLATPHIEAAVQAREQLQSEWRQHLIGALHRGRRNLQPRSRRLARVDIDVQLRIHDRASIRPCVAEFDAGNFTLLISHTASAIIHDHGNVYTASQGSFSGRQAAHHPQAQWPDPRGALDVAAFSAMSALAPSVSYLSMIESGKRAPSTELLALLAAVFQREPEWFLDESADIELTTACGTGRRGGAHSARARVPLLQERAAGGHPGVAGADRHDWPAVCSPADPLPPGDVAQRLSGPGACRGQCR